MDATTVSFSEIPIVDFERWTKADASGAMSFAEEVCSICHNVGFFVLVNHGVDPAVSSSLFATMRDLFALPTEVKSVIDKRHSRHFRGWEHVGSESTNNRPDIREQIDLWSDLPARASDAVPPYLRLLGPNQWLPDDVVPGHRDVIERWISQTQSVGHELLAVLGLGLGLDGARLPGLFGPASMSLTKLIHYPPTPPGAAGVNGHHDTGFLTLLMTDETPGLEVQSPTGQWIPVPVVSDAFVINLGEMLQALTGNYFVATPHRVITEEERFSAGFFLGPPVDTPLTALTLDHRFAEAVAASPRHANAGFMAQAAETDAGVADMSSPHRPDTYGEQIWNYFVRSYPDIVKKHYPELVPR